MSFPKKRSSAHKFFAKIILSMAFLFNMGICRYPEYQSCCVKLAMKICPSQKGFIHAQILGKTNSEHSYWLWQYIKYYIFGRQVDIDQDFRKLVIISPFHFFQNLHTTLAHPPFVSLHPLFVPLSPSRCTLTLSGSIPAASCSSPESSLYCSSTFPTDCKCPKLSMEVFREIIWWELFLNHIVHRIGKIAKPVNTENSW